MMQFCINTVVKQLKTWQKKFMLLQQVYLIKLQKSVCAMYYKFLFLKIMNVMIDFCLMEVRKKIKEETEGFMKKC